MFALACLYFQESSCDFAVFEAGIGGRYDPVRLVGALCTCVTSVDYEHVELLGHSLELIVSDKSDACASGGTIVYGENCRSLRPHILEYNRYREITTAVFPRPDRHRQRDRLDDCTTFRPAVRGLDFRILETSLLGAFQINNAAIAVTLFLLWLRRTQPEKPLRTSKPPSDRASATARWPGRLEVIQQEPLTVIDVGHTPDGIRQSLASLKAIHGADDWILVVGISFDKKADEIVALLAPSFDTIICTAAHHKGASAASIAASVAESQSGRKHSDRRHHRGRGRRQPNARRIAKTKIYVAGGLFLAIEYADHRPRRTRPGPGFFLSRPRLRSRR